MSMRKMGEDTGRDAYKAAKVTEPTDLLSACQNEIFGKKHKQMEARKGKQDPLKESGTSDVDRGTKSRIAENC